MGAIAPGQLCGSSTPTTTTGPNITLTGDVTPGSPNLTNVSTLVGVTAGMTITAPSVPPGTTVVSVGPGSTIVMSANGTAPGGTGLPVTLATPPAQLTVTPTELFHIDLKADGDMVLVRRWATVNPTSGAVVLLPPGWKRMNGTPYAIVGTRIEGCDSDSQSGVAQFNGVPFAITGNLSGTTLTTVSALGAVTVGMTVAGAGITPGTKVTAVAVGTVTLSAPVTPGVAVPVTFSPPLLVTPTIAWDAADFINDTGADITITFDMGSVTIPAGGARPVTGLLFNREFLITGAGTGPVTWAVTRNPFPTPSKS